LCIRARIIFDPVNLYKPTKEIITKLKKKCKMYYLKKKIR
jgi:hypothetical protein